MGAVEPKENGVEEDEAAEMDGVDWTGADDVGAAEKENGAGVGFGTDSGTTAGAGAGAGAAAGAPNENDGTGFGGFDETTGAEPKENDLIVSTVGGGIPDDAGADDGAAKLKGEGEGADKVGRVGNLGRGAVNEGGGANDGREDGREREVGGVDATGTTGAMLKVGNFNFSSTFAGAFSSSCLATIITGAAVSFSPPKATEALRLRSLSSLSFCSS